MSLELHKRVLLKESESNSHQTGDRYLSLFTVQKVLKMLELIEDAKVIVEAQKPAFLKGASDSKNPWLTKLEETFK